MTNSTELVHNASKLDDPNDEWLLRSRLLQKSNLDDCLQRKGFHGTIAVILIVKNNRVIGMDSEIKQTIRQ